MSRPRSVTRAVDFIDLQPWDPGIEVGHKQKTVLFVGGVFASDPQFTLISPPGKSSGLPTNLTVDQPDLAPRRDLVVPRM